MELVGVVTSINSSDGMLNLIVSDKDRNITNLKISNEDGKSIKIGSAYLFKYDEIKGTERISNKIVSFTDINNLDLKERDKALRSLYRFSPFDLEYSEKEINKYINKIDNDIIKDITNHLIKKYYDKYFVYPAASKMHHAYIGGLAHHCIGMLHMSEGFIENYDYLDKNYIYAGIILHDIGKAIELSGNVNTEYTIKGQLLGHLVLGAMEISDAAKTLGYENSEEAMILEHMLVSHHGVPQFGSPKKPMTAEALVLWYIDTIDSKFRVLGDELKKTDSGSFTESIGVIDKSKIYKPQQ